MKTKRTIFNMFLPGLTVLALLAGCTSPESLPEEPAASQGRSEKGTINSGNGNLAVSTQKGDMPESGQYGNMNTAQYDLSAAAELLGISEDALISVIGDARINNQTDFASVAEVLGISEDELREALLAIPMNERNGQSGENEAGKGNDQGAGQSNSGAGRQDNQQGSRNADRQGTQQGYQDIDFASASLALGISEEDLIAAVEGNLGYGPPDFEAVAATLDVTTDELLEAIGHE
jgi:hypothetical protein